MVSAGSHHEEEEELDGALSLALSHRALQQKERRRQRENVRMRLLLLQSVAADDVKRRRGDDCQARELELLQQITKRRGFITQELQSQATLRPLDRWYHQLQLISLKATTIDSADARDGSSVDDDEDEDHAMALLKIERVLAQDVACFDLQYASGTRVQDVVTRLLDGTHSQFSPPVEILSFSTMKRGRVCRITCVRTTIDQQHQSQYAFHSSLFIRDFAAKATQLLNQSSDAQSLIEFVRSEPLP